MTTHTAGYLLIALLGFLLLTEWIGVMPAIVIVAISASAFFVWALCRVAADSDARLEEEARSRRIPPRGWD